MVWLKCKFLETIAGVLTTTILITTISSPSPSSSAWSTCLLSSSWPPPPWYHLFTLAQDSVGTPISSMLGLVHPSRALPRLGTCGKFRWISFIFTNSNVLQMFQKNISPSDASFQNVRDPQTGGEGTFVMFLAERRALVVMEADMVKVYEKNCIGFLSTVMVNV